MDSKLIEELLHEEEGAALDFKRDQYLFDGSDDVTKSELLKDILACANAWRRSDAYILIGVEDIKGGRSKPVGVLTHHDDAKLQQFVNSKTNRPISFSYETVTIDGVQTGILRVEMQERPFFLKKDYGKLKAGVVYIRRGSSTDTADPDEIHRMGAASEREEKPPTHEEKLKVALQGHGAASSPPPFGTGEPLHLEIDLTIVNLGNSPVFIVAAALKDPARRRSIGFDVCNENEPLQPGGRRMSKFKMMHHRPFPEKSWSARTPEQLFQQNLFAFKLLRYICQEDSAFHIETGRGTELIYPATEVCDECFLSWPFLMTPDDVRDAIGRKSLKDFDEEELAAFRIPTNNPS